MSTRGTSRGASGSVGISVARSAGEATTDKESAFAQITAISGYQAIFDYKATETVLNASSNPASNGETVARWNSIDNASVYFSEATNRPSLMALGIQPTGGSQLLRSNGIGDTDSRTVVLIYEIPIEAQSNHYLFDGDVLNSFHGAHFPADQGVNLRVDETIPTARVNGKGIKGIAAFRKSGSAGSVYTINDGFIRSVAYDGLRQSTGLNLFSRGTSGSRADAGPPIFKGAIIFDQAVSDADLVTLSEQAAIYFADDRRTINLVDGMGQSNQSGRASRVGITRYDSVAAKIADSDSQFDDFLFGTNHNIGGDATTNQFGHESEVLLQSPSLTVYNKSAEGGTSLAVDWNPNTSGTNWVNAMGSATRVRRMLQVLGYNVRSRGLIWAQGERDARDVVNTPRATYSGLLQDLITDYRSRFGASLPVVLVQIKSTDLVSYSNLANIQGALQDVADADPNVSIIDTSSDINFPLLDTVHFDDEAQKNIGIAAEANLA